MALSLSNPTNDAQMMLALKEEFEEYKSFTSKNIDSFFLCTMALIIFCKNYLELAGTLMVGQYLIKNRMTKFLKIFR